MKAIYLILIIVTAFVSNISGQTINFGISYLSNASGFYNGQQYTISYTVGETSDGTYLPAKVAIYYSSNSQLGANDKLLDSNTVYLTAASNTQMVYRTVTMPANLVSVTGPGYIILKVDFYNTTAEVNEDDNLSSYAATFHKPVYDIDVSYMGVDIPSGCAGQDNNALVQMSNRTDYTTGFVITGLYLSSNNNLSTGDILLALDTLGILNDYPVPSSRNITFIIPQSTAPGTYYIIAKADIENRIVETYESNNYCNVQITVEPCAPEVRASNFILNKDTANSGNHIEYGVQLENIGTEDANDALFSIVCSLDSIYDEEDVLVQSSTLSLSIGHIGTLSGGFNLPGGFINSNYYVIIKIDADNSYAEANEDDNVAITKLYILGLMQSVYDGFDNDYSIEVYPAGHVMNVKARPNSEVQLYNSTGQLVHSSQLLTGNAAISITGLSGGFYIASIVNNNTRVYNRKFSLRAF